MMFFDFNIIMSIEYYYYYKYMIPEMHKSLGFEIKNQILNKNMEFLKEMK